MYPLQIPQSSMQINITVYVAGSSDILEALINNTNFLRVQTAGIPLRLFSSFLLQKVLHSHGKTFCLVQQTIKI